MHRTAFEMSIFLVLLVLEQYLLVRTPFYGLHLIHYTSVYSL